jgi:hypothetical protein
MHPTDHISTKKTLKKHNLNILDLVYCFHERITSGARYHLVATYSVKKPFQSSEGLATRAKPKSQIFKEQSPFTKRLLGFWNL